jgi:hypothetical protein
VVGLVIVFYNHYLAFRGIQNLRVVVPSEHAEGEAVPQPSTTGTTESLLEQ